MRGVLALSAYIPSFRVDRSHITATLGSGGGRGTRSAASFDEDATTMAVEAARKLRPSPAELPLDAVVFATTNPAYSDRTNATTAHAALRLPSHVAVGDANGSVRSAAATLRAALRSDDLTLLLHADLRDGLPGSGDESQGGDAAAAALIGNDAHGPLIAEYLGGASITAEFVDRWRTPGDSRSKLWEERFGEIQYLDAGRKAWAAALAACSMRAEDIDVAVVAGLHQRAVKSVGGSLKAKTVADDRADVIGQTGAAHPMLLLADCIERSAPGQVIALVVLSDGADVFLFRTTDAVTSRRSTDTVAHQISRGKPLAYGKFLTWRGRLPIEPPRRPEPARASSSASTRNDDWKFGFVGARDTATGTVELPPSKMSADGTVGSIEPAPMAQAQGTVATFTIDRLAYSPSPPIVFAVVDFDGGGRLPIELAEASPDEVTIGARVEPTFRRLGTSDGIHNYFWKARLIDAPSS